MIDCKHSRLNPMLSIVIAGMSVLMTAVPVRAHHSFAAEFDQTKPIKLQGTVTKMEWINPHSWIHMDVKDESGETVSWMIEGGTPNLMLRRGFTRKSLEAGTQIIVEGFLSRDGAKRANGNSITFTDGRKLFVGGSSPNTPPAPPSP